MSVYDEARERAEYLASLLDTPVLAEDGERLTGYQRVELARIFPECDGPLAGLSSGEKAVMRICRCLVSIGSDVVDVDEFLAHEVGTALHAVALKLIGVEQ